MGTRRRFPLRLQEGWKPAGGFHLLEGLKALIMLNDKNEKKARGRGFKSALLEKGLRS